MSVIKIYNKETNSWEQVMGGSGGSEYIHPSTHPADMITDTESKKIMTAEEREKLKSLDGGGSVSIVDNLLSDSIDSALSANQGKVLNEKIDTEIQGVNEAISNNTNNINELQTEVETLSAKPSIDVTLLEKLSNKNQPDGYLGLDSEGKIPADYLSYVSGETNLEDITLDKELDTVETDVSVSDNLFTIISKIWNKLTKKEDKSNKNIADGYVGLDSDGYIPLLKNTKMRLYDNQTTNNNYGDAPIGVSVYRDVDTRSGATLMKLYSLADGVFYNLTINPVILSTECIAEIEDYQVLKQEIYSDVGRITRMIKRKLDGTVLSTSVANINNLGGWEFIRPIAKATESHNGILSSEYFKMLKTHLNPLTYTYSDNKTTTNNYIDAPLGIAKYIIADNPQLKAIDKLGKAYSLNTTNDSFYIKTIYLGKSIINNTSLNINYQYCYYGDTILTRMLYLNSDGQLVKSNLPNSTDTETWIVDNGVIDLQSSLNELSTQINNKQDKIVAGENITIDGNTIAATNTTYSVATTSNNGLMASTDKTKLDGIATGANKTIINNTLTSTSTTQALSAYQGKVLNDKIAQTKQTLNIGYGTIDLIKQGDVVFFSMNAKIDAPYGDIEFSSFIPAQYRPTNYRSSTGLIMGFDETHTGRIYTALIEFDPNGTLSFELPNSNDVVSFYAECCGCYII